MFADLFYSICSLDRTIRCNHSGSVWTWTQWQWTGTPHSPNLQGWSLIIRWFHVIIRTLVERGGLNPLQSECFTAPVNWAETSLRKIYKNVWVEIINTFFFSFFQVSNLIFIIQMNMHEQPRNSYDKGTHTFDCADGVTVIIVRNGHGDLTSNSGRGSVHFKLR